MSMEKIVVKTVFVFYVVITFIMLLRHEVWFDEAQAWVIARDVPMKDFINTMTHEGHPLLWPLILMPFARTGFPVIALGVISWFFMCIAQWIVMFRSPFTSVLKIAIALSAGMIYINNTVARIYCLIPLILFLIAMIYNKREKYPVLYGFLLGLLANTHIMMCGTVAVLGILMCADTLKKWKKRSIRENIKQLCGLCIGGLLVIVLLIPMFWSMVSNNYTAENEYTVGIILFNLLRSFTVVGGSLFGETQFAMDSLVFEFFAGVFFIVSVTVFLLMLRRKVTVFTITVISLFAQVVVTCVIWYIIPNRAAIIVCTMLFGLWIFIESDEAKTTKRILPQGSVLVRNLYSMDGSAEKIMSIVLTVVLFLTVPLSVYFICTDFVRGFAPSKQTTEYISENIPEDAVLLVENDAVQVVMAAYLPERKYWDVTGQRYVTYCHHDEWTDSSDVELEGVVERNFENTDNMYVLDTISAVYSEKDIDCIYMSDASVPFYAEAYKYVIYKYTDDFTF